MINNETPTNFFKVLIRSYLEERNTDLFTVSTLGLCLLGIHQTSLTT